MQLIGVALGNLYSACVGRNDHEVVAQTGHVINQNRHCGEMVDGTIEETLDLTRVQIDRDQTVCAGRFKHICDQLRRDGFASFGLTILTGVAIERRNRSDPLCRRALCSVDHDQLFHDCVVHRHFSGADVRLNDEHIGATY